MSNFSESICEKLQSSDRKVKLKALKELLDFAEPSSGTSSPDLIVSAFDECYLHILKCYSDKFESCREQSAEVVNAFISVLPTNDFYLENIVATMASRIGIAETIEPSEEIRYIYLCQLNTLIKRYNIVGNTKALSLLYDEISKILVRRLRDDYPAVQKEACSCIVNLCSSADYSFQSYADNLSKSVFPVLNHKHSKNRIAAIEALGCLALQVNASSDSLHRIFTEFSPLLMDSMPLVRRECGRVGCHLLIELKDRYSYFDRLIPLVLCCLKDDSPEVRDYIQPLWEKSGKQYYDENEAELSKIEIADCQPANYPSGVIRPTIGCRGLVQRSLRLVNLIIRETSDWKDNVRLHSLKLLYQFVLHAESAMTAKLFEIYSDLAKACRDNVTAVSNEALKVADLMGRLFIYDDWKEHAIDGLAKNLKLGHLKCCCHMFLAAAASEIKREDFVRLSAILVQRELSQSLRAEVQLYVLTLAEGLWTKLIKNNSLEETLDKLTLNENAGNLERNLYVATIKVMALSFEKELAAENFLAMGNLILEKIACKQNIKIGKLHEKYFQFALEYVDSLDAPLDGLSEPILLFYGLLNICKFRPQYMSQLRSKIILVWNNSADDAKVKVFGAISIAMLSWHETIDCDLQESINLLKEFLDEVVVDNLVWKAGANAESMRSLATATLCALSQGASEEAAVILPQMAKYFPSLVEDHSVSTRNYALKCLSNLNKVKVEELKPIAYAILRRLDDPSAEVRELAAMVVPKLSPLYDKEADKKFELEIWQNFIRKALTMFFIHFEGPENRLKAALKESIVALGKQYPDVFVDRYARAFAMCANKSELSDIQDAVNQK